MDQQYEANRQTGLWLERLVWNLAAGAVLAVMILLLLGSLRLMDSVAPETEGVPSAVSAVVATEAEFDESGEGAAAAAQVVAAPPDRSTEVAEFNRPSP